MYALQTYFSTYRSLCKLHTCPGTVVPAWQIKVKQKLRNDEKTWCFLCWPQICNMMMGTSNNSKEIFRIFKRGIDLANFSNQPSMVYRFQRFLFVIDFLSQNQSHPYLLKFTCFCRLFEKYYISIWNHYHLVSSFLRTRYVLALPLCQSIVTYLKQSVLPVYLLSEKNNSSVWHVTLPRE